MHFFASADKAKRELGWKPKHDFQKDVQGLVNDYKANVSAAGGATVPAQELGWCWGRGAGRSWRWVGEQLGLGRC